MTSLFSRGARTLARTSSAVMLGGLILLGGCRHTGSFIWVNDLTSPREAPAQEDYVIRPGDVVSVRVFTHENMSGRARVRNDGRISVPFLKDVVAAGYSPSDFAEQLQTRLKNFINNPVVTVSLEEVQPLQVPVLGEVARPGSYPLEPGSGVLAALAASGGLTDYASADAIYVVRQKPEPQRIRFRYDALAGGEPKATRFRLQAGDAVVVE